MQGWPGNHEVSAQGPFSLSGPSHGTINEVRPEPFEYAGWYVQLGSRCLARFSLLLPGRSLAFTRSLLGGASQSRMW